MLSMGGNAFDAAVAASLSLGVVEPAASGLGGNAMAMVYTAADRRVFALENPCVAPLTATPEEVAKHPRKAGYKAVAVPTLLRTLDHMLSKYGSLSRETVCTPAIRLAEEGHVITPVAGKVLGDYLKSLRSWNGGAFMLTGQGLPPEVGTVFRQPVLARTLQRLAEKGFSDFYTGETGRMIALDMEQHDGFISASDLAQAPQPKEKAPLYGQFGGMTVCCLPPPGGGTTLVEILNIYECLAGKGVDPDAPEGALLLAAIINRARSDRKTYIPTHVMEKLASYPDLTSLQYAETAGEQIREALQPGDTTHFNVMDRFGNVVAMTQSIERCYGAKVATGALGFLYNGYMKAFKIQNKKHLHYLRPGAVARSNACPAILMKNGFPHIAIGSTGSERMISGIAQTLIRLSRGMTPFEAVSSPRLHCTPDREVYYEPERFSPEVIQHLERHGFKAIAYDSPWSFKSGGLQMAVCSNGLFTGVADPRRSGAAGGPD
ncbi:gamma-glutamyltranspeptidase [Desulfoluna limicola]|uniref:Gamma-glutamyltranspeptidase n=2 Tax=Desulfoluna limicola TaxID=2810562 RepID=A0ABM7PD66_9BACT|nr:gamma-glutamyltranspeptidase [Desulfoluna limicola]